MKLLNIKYYCYADDAQVYVILKPCDKWDEMLSSTEI